MKTTDIPTFDNVISHFMVAVGEDDMKCLLTKEANTDNRGTIGGVFTGGCILISETDRKFFPVFVEDDWFRRDGHTDVEKLMLGMLVKRVSGELCIYINHFTRALFVNVDSRDFAIGLLGHEMGHFLAGHTDREEKPAEVHIEPHSLKKYTTRLLSGDPCHNTDELEANLYGIGLVGIGPILTNLAMQSSRSDNIGMRMSFSNQLHQLIDITTRPDFVAPTSPYKDIEIEILTDEEIEAVRQAPADDAHDPKGTPI